MGRFCKNDPKGLVLQHAGHVSSCWPHDHDNFEDEIFTEGAQYWEEVLHRSDNPSMTRFKEMNMDEQVYTIEHTTQESIRKRRSQRNKRGRRIKKGDIVTRRSRDNYLNIEGISPT
jgi:hypothetical protein